MAWHLGAAMFCLAVAIFAEGIVAILAVTAIGFFVSIFFPTLYALAIKDMGDLTGQASGLITLGFLGCALMPVLQGRIADQIGISRSYCLGFLSYLFAMFYVLKGSRMKRADTN
jgi:FHS family L-fucose permease-like MFS transporter